MNEIEEQIKKFKKCQQCLNTDCYGCKNRDIDIDLCIAALHSQLTREQNEPLTLEELKGMDGEPYWQKSLIGHEDRWIILDPFIAKHPEEYHYGETWLAYRDKPNK